MVSVTNTYLMSLTDNALYCTYFKHDQKQKNSESYGQLWLTPWAYTHDSSPHQDRLAAWGARAVRAIRSVHGVAYKNARASAGIFKTGAH